MAKSLMFVCLTKVDEEKQEVWGLATEEVEDCSGEIFDYETSKPYFEQWSEHAQKISGGKSKGNLRLMHQLEAVGKLVDIEFNDVNKQILVGAKVVDESAWTLVKEGVLVGFSIGGSYVKTWKDNGLRRYTAKPVEISLVDLPCVPTALYDSVKAAEFEFVKVGGEVEKRGFSVNPMKKTTDEQLGEILDLLKEARTKRVAGEDLTASAFLIVGDKNDTSTWKLPVKFSTEEKTKSHIRNALARIDQLKDVSAEDKARAKKKLESLAREYGIDSKKEKAAQVALAKSLYDVQDLAGMLQGIMYLRNRQMYEGEYEGDEGNLAIAESIQEWLNDGADILREVLEEELEELTAASKAVTKGVNMFDFVKGRAVSMQDHFKKSAASHEAMAGCYKAMADKHQEMADDNDEDDKEQSKAHKVMAAQHTKLFKAHTAHAEHLTKMAAACEHEKAATGEDMSNEDKVEIQKMIDDAVTKALGKPLEEAVTKAVAAAKPADPAQATAAVQGEAIDMAKFTGEIGKSLATAVEKAMEPLSAKLEEVTKGLADQKKQLDDVMEKTVAAPPTGLSLIPRTNAAAAGGEKPVSDSDTGM